MDRNKLKILYSSIISFFLILSIIIMHINKGLNCENNNIVIINESINNNKLYNYKSFFSAIIEKNLHMPDNDFFRTDNTSKFKNLINISKCSNSLVKMNRRNNKINIFSNDLCFNAQWAIKNPGNYSYISGESTEIKDSSQGIDLDLEDAWGYMGVKNDNEVVVAIIDTGVDYKHPDLAPNMWVNSAEIPDDNVDNDKNGYIDDVNGWDFYNSDSSVCHYSLDNNTMASNNDNDNHGTHVAGIIAAEANNKIGIAGVASNINIKIMPLKINGGPNRTGTISKAIEAIKYAEMMGADICNLSWGIPKYSMALSDVIKESDMLLIAAAGNAGSNNDITPIYPASLKLDNLISVTSIDAFGRLTSLSNYGLKSVDLAAPGEEIYSTVVGGYSYMSGSSMAAPYVAGVAALLYSYGDNIYASNVKDIILKNIKKISALEGLLIYPGIPSAYLTIKSNDLIFDNKPPKITFDTIYNYEGLGVKIIAEDYGGAGIRIIKWLSGERNINEFNRGFSGNAIVDNTVYVPNEGKYTFYISDYAGNEIKSVYKINEDKNIPIIITSYNNNTLTIKVKDSQSGIKAVKYQYGKKTYEDFVTYGNTLDLKDGRCDIIIKNKGFYTVYACDNRGNIAYKHIYIK